MIVQWHNTAMHDHSNNMLEIRKRMKLTQQQLADKLGIDRTYVAKIETGGDRLTAKMRTRLKGLSDTCCMVNVIIAKD